MEYWSNVRCCLLIVLLWTCTASAQEPTTRILCFGDSITRGTYINGKYTHSKSWVTQLDALAGPGIKVLNGGRSGRKTSDYREFDKIARQNPQIDHVIFFLGVNDLRVANDKVLKSCVTNMEILIKKARAVYGPTVAITILTSPGLEIGKVSKRFDSKGYNAKEQAMLDRLRGEYKALAARTNCGFIDLWGVVSAGNYTDGLHPNLAGQKQIAETLWKVLKTRN